MAHIRKACNIESVTNVCAPNIVSAEFVLPNLLMKKTTRHNIGFALIAPIMFCGVLIVFALCVAAVLAIVFGVVWLVENSEWQIAAIIIMSISAVIGGCLLHDNEEFMNACKDSLDKRLKKF